MVRLLVDKDKADINSKDADFGQTPPPWAADSGHEALVRLLIDISKSDY